MGTTPSNSINSVKISGLRAKTNIRMQQIARYRITGRLTDAQIAERVGLTPQGIARILALPEYKDLEDSLLEGHISAMDEAVAGNVDELKATMQVAVPLALRTLVETVQQRRDLRAAMSAASEILDRDPDRTFAKVSRNTENPNANIFNPGNDAKLVATLTAVGNAVSIQMMASGPNPTNNPLPTTSPIDVLPNVTVSKADGSSEQNVAVNSTDPTTSQASTKVVADA